jgi:hypothetical protein
MYSVISILGSTTLPLTRQTSSYLVAVQELVNQLSQPLWSQIWTGESGLVPVLRSNTVKLA